MPISLSPWLTVDSGVKEEIKRAVNEGVCVVVAAGNFGPLINTLSPHALIKDVISVGAASIDGHTLADFSSRGIPGNEYCKPTIVAPGIDLIGLWPSNLKKTPDQTRKDK